MNQNKNYKFIDLFAGAGGLSEGFIRAGFEPIAHIEMDHYACDTLKTRAAYHYLKANNKLSIYEQYLRTKKEKTDGAWLWNQVPKEVIDTVIQEAIGKETIDGIFKKVDRLCKGQKVDIIIGGPHLPFKMLNGNRTDISGDTKEYSLKMGVGAWILDSVIPHKSPDGPKAGGL